MAYIFFDTRTDLRALQLKPSHPENAWMAHAKVREPSPCL